jgi:hypothetical protein
MIFYFLTNMHVSNRWHTVTICLIRNYESLNQAIATVAPKNVCYSGSGSLYSRIAMVIGIHNLGNELFFKQVLQQLSVFLDGHNTFVTKTGSEKGGRFTK